MKKEKLIIPITLLTEIEKSDYKRKDDLYCILDTIYSSQIRFRTKLHRQYGFALISKSRFAKLVPNHTNLKNALNFLTSNFYIRENTYYIMYNQPRGYKIEAEFLGKTVEVSINDKKINERILKLRYAKRKVRVKNIEFSKSKYYKTFKIDKKGAMTAATEIALTDLRELTKGKMKDEKLMDIINCDGGYVKYRAKIIIDNNESKLHSILHRLMMHQQTIFSIANGNLFFRRNSTNGRLDSNLTTLPTYLRKYITCDEKLFNLDIKNSQPYFLFTELRNSPLVDKEELEKYKQITTDGVLYEYLVEKYGEIAGRTKTRLEMKKILFKIFYSKVSSYANYKDFFRELFPTIMDFIDSTNANSNSTLAVSLQVKESTTILDIITTKLQALGIMPYTIHDSFVITELETPIVKGVIESTCIELYGIAPKLHEESLTDAPIDEYEDEEDDDLTFDEWLEVINKEDEA